MDERLSEPIAGYYPSYSHYFANTGVNDCAWLAMRNYEDCRGIYYIKNNGCFLQDASRTLTKAQLLAGESPNPPEPMQADSTVYTYIIDEQKKMVNG